ncbi:unnamed protein product [Spodoptera exigua]|nr:unnamed protein product [Spodoptera exigua]
MLWYFSTTWNRYSPSRMPENQRPRWATILKYTPRPFDQNADDWMQMNPIKLNNTTTALSIPGKVFRYEGSNRNSVMNTVFVDPMVWGGGGGSWLGYAMIHTQMYYAEQ